MTFSIETNSDITKVVHYTLSFSEEIGFNRTNRFMIATATSELARNILVHAEKGEIVIGKINRGNKQAVEIKANDNGPGIPDIELALQDHYSTKNSLGIGLPGTKRLMDEFEIESEVGKGTWITTRKWL